MARCGRGRKYRRRTARAAADAALHLDRKEFDSACARLTSHPDAAAFFDRRATACCRRAWKQLVGSDGDDVRCARLNCDAVAAQLREMLVGQRDEHDARDAVRCLDTARSAVKSHVEPRAAPCVRCKRRTGNRPAPTPTAGGFSVECYRMAVLKKAECWPHDARRLRLCEPPPSATGKNAPHG